MITFFTHTRPFDDEFGPLQKTAIASWQSAVPGCQVILFGHDHPIKTNTKGTALIDSLFTEGERLAEHDLLCEVSSDIVFSADFYTALKQITGIERPFVIGQRWDINPGAPPDTAVLHAPAAADYFIYRKGTLGEIPPFAIGRTVYDNWLIWAAVHRWNMTTIDATGAITAIHLNHSHPEYGDKQKMLQSQEKRENNRLAKKTGCNQWPGTNYAPYILNGTGVVKR